jgi:hypothetical protein
VNRLEQRWLADDDSWWTGRNPTFARVVAEVPGALYLNYLAPKAYAASLAPHVFRPLDLPGDDQATLFTILLFTLKRARPRLLPSALAALAPTVMQSNWRFYGHITQPGSDHRAGVLFVRTVTTSLMLAAFGRRLARCFPLRRARQMSVVWDGDQVTGIIEPGHGSAPGLAFEGEKSDSPPVSRVFGEQFPSYDQYARWIIDQHLSLVIWPREYVVQDMHLDFQEARITPLRCRRCSLSKFEELPSDQLTLIDCFAVEGLRVFLDDIYRAIFPLHAIMRGIKGYSARLINERMGSRSSLWQEESFDRVLRSSESLDAKVAYILANPVRGGLVSVPSEYPWIWTRPVENIFLPQR